MFVYMIVVEEICGEISVRKDKGSDRKSRPPWEEEKKLIWSRGKNLVSPKSHPSEFVEGKKSSLAGDIATLLCRIASRYPPTLCMLLKSPVYQVYSSVNASVCVKSKIFTLYAVCAS